MEKRYRALRIVGTMYKIIGGVVLILALVSAVGACLAGILGGASLSQFSQDFGNNLGRMGLFGPALGGILAGLGMLIFGGLGGLTLFATGEGIYLLLAIEENTRAVALNKPI